MRSILVSRISFKNLHYLWRTDFVESDKSKSLNKTTKRQIFVIFHSKYKNKQELWNESEQAYYPRQRTVHRKINDVEINGEIMLHIFSCHVV
jgi:hypothetical protein